MAFSYSALNNYGKSGLPSIESWGTDMNILRDPPKSIMTRRINKVGETSDITSMIDDSGNRACESIREYALGVNPMVSVDYSNAGNNGGQRSGGITVGGQGAAYLPYGTAKDGAFRPPVMMQEQLMPLSRLPRNSTTAFSNPAFPDYAKKLMTCGDAKDYRQVKTDTLKVSVRPTAVYRVEKPISEPFEVKYVIQPSLHTSAHSGRRTMDHTTQHVKEPSKVINHDNIHAFAQSNVASYDLTNQNVREPSNVINHDNIHAFAQSNGVSYDQTIQNVKEPSKVINHDNIHAFATANQNDQNRYVNHSKFNPDRYLQDANSHSAGTNPSSNMCVTPITEILDLSDMPVHDSISHVSHTAPVSGHEQNNLEHQPLNLTRRLPEYQTSTNKGQDIYKTIQPTTGYDFQRNMPISSWEANPGVKGNSDNGSREYRLAPKIQPGGYTVPAQMPLQGRMQNVQIPHESEHAKMSRSVFEQQMSRFV